jgi:hypothetical protein
LFFDTNFNGHTLLYEEFKLTVVTPAVIQHGLTLDRWHNLLADPVLQRLYDEKILFPFVGLVRERSPSMGIGETAVL